MCSDRISREGDSDISHTTTIGHDDSGSMLGLTEAQYARYATALCKMAIGMWLLSGILRNLWLGRFLSLSTVLPVCSRDFRRGGSGLPGFCSVPVLAVGLPGDFTRGRQGGGSGYWATGIAVVDRAACDRTYLVCGPVRGCRERPGQDLVRALSMSKTHSKVRRPQGHSSKIVKQFINGSGSAKLVTTSPVARNPSVPQVGLADWGLNRSWSK